jgi:Putative lactococcus lactis phage r1t holin
VNTITTPAFWKDAGEKAISTFAQMLVVMLFSTKAPVISDPPWKAAVIAALIAGGISVLTSLASAPFPEASNKWVDLLVRTVKTFLQSFVAALLVTDYVNVNWQGAAAVALPVALLSLLKGLIAFGVPGTVPGAGLVPATAEPAPPAGDEVPAPEWPKPAGHVEL